MYTHTRAGLGLPQPSGAARTRSLIPSPLFQQLELCSSSFIQKIHKHRNNSYPHLLSFSATPVSAAPGCAARESKAPIAQWTATGSRLHCFRSNPAAHSASRACCICICVDRQSSDNDQHRRNLHRATVDKDHCAGCGPLSACHCDSVRTTSMAAPTATRARMAHSYTPHAQGMAAIP